MLFGTSRPLFSKTFIAAWALLALTAPILRAGEGWAETYRKGIAEREKGGCPAAAFYLLQALNEHPQPRAAVRVDAATTMDYLPRLMLADCLCRMGDRNLAGRYWKEAGPERALGTPSAKELAAGVMQCLNVPSAAPNPRETDVLQRARIRCGLPEERDQTLYPWYFDYEVSQDFLKAGEYDAGIRYLYHAIGKKAAPQEKARMYGMWFSDYHPYFLLAKALFHEGNYLCASDALAQSLKTEDLSSSPVSERERTAIRKDLEELPPGR